MKQITGFPPIENPDARLLILGSMPGVESLRKNQYYAHPRNAFWPIMGELFGAAPTLPYQTRTEILKSSGIAVWDVLASCHRPGSLDADISATRANDFASFFQSHPHIEQLCFNGAMAEKLFLRQVMLKPRGIYLVRLPSSSPAHAAMSYPDKVAQWRDGIHIQRPR